MRLRRLKEGFQKLRVNYGKSFKRLTGTASQVRLSINSMLKEQISQ